MPSKISKSGKAEKVSKDDGPVKSGITIKKASGTGERDVGEYDAYGNRKGVPEKPDRDFKIKKDADPIKNLSDFQKFYDAGNVTIDSFRETVKNIGSGVARAMRNSGKPDSPNNAVYKQLVTDSPTMSLSVNNVTNKISGVPKMNSVINVEGRLMLISSGKIRSNIGRNHDVFEIMDLSSGEKKQFRGKKSADYIGDGGSNLKTWALNLDGK
jgi:hypothetical protein